MSKLEILESAAAHRSAEVLHHQINIDNYRLAIADIHANHEDKPHMIAFAEQLGSLLASSIQEQDKEKVMLKVIQAQLDELAAHKYGLTASLPGGHPYKTVAPTV